MHAVPLTNELHAGLGLLVRAGQVLAEPGDSRGRLSRVLSLLTAGLCRHAALELHGMDDQRTLISAADGTVFDDLVVSVLQSKRSDDATYRLDISADQRESGEFSRIEPEHLELLRSAQIAEILIVPLLRARRAVGSLVVLLRRGEPLGEDQCALIELLAGQLSSHIVLDHFRRRVVWVEQQRGQRERYGKTLLESGFAIYKASSPEEAVQRAREVVPNVLIVECDPADPFRQRVRAQIKADPIAGRIPLVELGPDHASTAATFYDALQESASSAASAAEAPRLEPDGGSEHLLALLSEQVRRSERAEMLLAIVSHDLRSPLAAVRLAANILSAESLPDRQRRVVNRLDSASSQLTRLVQDLLDFTAARSTGIKLVHGSADVHAIARTTIEDLRATWPLRKIEHVCSGDGAATVDADRVAQVVANLVGNALQHSPPSSTVVVETLGDSDRLHLRVTNPGEPISSELMPVLFAPLHRGPAAGQRPGSSGLGLFIAQHLILSHGGNIGVVSNTADAITFQVELPRQPPSRESSAS